MGNYSKQNQNRHFNKFVIQPFPKSTGNLRTACHEMRSVLIKFFL